MREFDQSIYEVGLREALYREAQTIHYVAGSIERDDETDEMVTQFTALHRRMTRVNELVKELTGKELGDERESL